MDRLIFIDRRTGEVSLPPAQIEDALPLFDAGVAQIGSDRFRVDAEAGIRRMDSVIGRRRDAASDVGALATDLTFRRKRILEEPRAVPNSFKLFFMDQEVHPGAKQHTVVYGLGGGEAAVHRAGGKIPRVSGSYLEDSFGIVHIATSFTEDYFSKQSADFTGRNQADRDFRTCVRVLEEKANQINWFGHEPSKIFGMLTYPRLLKRTVGTAFDGTALPTDVLDALNALANYPVENSRGTMKPTRMVTSERVRNYLMSTRLGTVSDVTIGEFFVRNNEFIRKIESAWECKDAGGAGVDGILCYNDDRDSAAIVVPQGITTLPPYTLGLETTTIVVMTLGGAAMFLPGNNILGLVTPRT
jgi:hypothetical protein